MIHGRFNGYSSGIATWPQAHGEVIIPTARPGERQWRITGVWPARWAAQIRRGCIVSNERMRGVAWRVDARTRDGMLRAHMVGDDQPFILDPSDCVIIDDEDYCGGCGQIGCGHGGYSE